MKYLFRGTNRSTGEVMESFTANKNAARTLFIELNDIEEVLTVEGYRITRLRDLKSGDIFWCVKQSPRIDGFAGSEYHVFGKALVRGNYIREDGCNKYEAIYWDDINRTKYLRGNTWVTTDVTF